MCLNVEALRYEFVQRALLNDSYPPIRFSHILLSTPAICFTKFTLDQLLNISVKFQETIEYIKNNT